MTDRPVLGEYLDRTAIGTWMANRMHIWQMDLLTADELARYGDRRGLTLQGKNVTLLWQLGLLQADIIISDQRLRRHGLKLVGRDTNNRFLYADTREIQDFSKGWRAAASRKRPLPKHIEPLFHPFRYYVLYHLERVLSTNIVPWQALVAPKRYHQLLKFTLRNSDNWTRSKEALETVQYWNDITTLAVMAEPCVYEPIFGVFRRSVQIEEQLQREHIAQQWNDISPVYANIGQQSLEEILQTVSVDTQILDPNREVHTLICLVSGERRLKLEGRLGGALCLRTMAEIIRRSTEKALEIQLREEDERGFGWAPPDLKKNLYGSPRLLDGDPQAVKEYLRVFGLTPDTVLRWYVEGDTEYYALLSVFEDYSPNRVRLVNLHGAVAEKAGAGIAFRESLRADLETHVFSFVSIDGDVGKNVSAVRKSADDNEICGAFFISYPDFEFANFTLDELESVLWSVAQENNAPIDKREQLHEAIQGASTGKDLMRRANGVLRDYVQGISKGRTWGTRLMDYALTHPQREYAGKPETRLVIEALQMAFRAPMYNYTLEWRENRVDPNTGLPVPRSLGREEVARHISSNFPWYVDIMNQQQRIKTYATRTTGQ